MAVKMNPPKCPGCGTALAYLHGLWTAPYAPLFCPACKVIVPKQK